MAEVDRGRHPGFPSFNGLAGGPGSLAVPLGGRGGGSFDVALPGPYYDPQAAYKWYYIALSQQGYTVGWEDLNHTPPHYCGPVGDFRNECMVSDLVVTLGWERVWQLDKEAARWLAQRNLSKRCT